MSNPLVAAFKALGDPVRLRLFYLLSRHEELCVCHLTEALRLPQSTISRQLGVLRQADLATTRRDGKWMYYKLSDGLATPLAGMIEPINDARHQADLLQLEKVLHGMNPPCSRP